MIPVIYKKEPSNFEEKVRKKGAAFLALVPKPTRDQWKGKDYWRSAIPELRTAYKGLCAYCAVKIPYSTGNPTVDHFLPKSVDASKAYEWDNFRLSSGRFNSRKTTKTIIDPFIVQHEWFVINFATFEVEVNDDKTIVNSQLRKVLEDTIDVLGFNRDEDLVYERIDFVKQYVDGEFTLSSLERYAPFIAFELKRQNLVDSIKMTKL